jgi:NAD(P)-dependent dehydrogenase (short-subunit alcohol dehydrogenase family)
MDLQLGGKRALITGASAGLGYACAQSLAQEGVSVAINSRSKEKLDEAVTRISAVAAPKVKVKGIAGDLSDEEELPRIVNAARAALGEIDILVVSTGHPPTYPFSAATDAQWQSGHDLVLRPSIVLSRLLLTGMRARRYGRIIFIGSIFGLEPDKSSVVQSTFRTGVNALAKCIANEVAPDGVTVNVICPGYFDTPLVRDLAKQFADQQEVSVEEVLGVWRTYSPVKRFGEPEDLGALVSFLSSPRGKFITGTCITIDGGAVRQF